MSLYKVWELNFIMNLYKVPDLSKSMYLRKIVNRAEFPTSTKNSNTHYARCIEIGHFVNIAKRARDHCSIFSTVQ